MRLEQSFEVPVPVARAWSVLLDLEQIAPCMPGATLTSFDGTAFAGTVKVKLGPISLAYKGTGRFTERDEAGRRLAFVAQGQDSRGAGGASARVTAVLHEAGGGSSTLVKVVADLDIAGRAAQFGRGMIADVSGKLVKQFADCLAETIAASGSAAVPAAAPAAAVNAVSPPAPPPLTPVFAEPTPPPPPAPVVAQPAPVFAEPTPPPPPVLAPVAVVPPAPVAPVFPPPPVGWEAPAPAPVEPAEEPAPVAWTPPAEEPAPVAWTPPEEPAVAWTPPPLLEEYAAPTPAYSAPPPPAVPETSEPVAAPTPIPAQASAPPPAADAATGLRQPPVEAEPIDLLAVSGAKGMLRRAAPVLIIVALALVGLVVWLFAR